MRKLLTDHNDLAVLFHKFRFKRLPGLNVIRNNYPLEPGDCLHMRFDRPQTFRNSSAAPTRYVVSLAPGRGMASR